MTGSLIEKWPLYDGGNERDCCLEETGRRLLFASTIDRVPVTRIADLTPLDVLGVPVFASVTPLARDLTTHLGKGVDRETARVSAVMEAVERVSAEEIEGKILRTTYTDLASSGVDVADPLFFDLPPTTSYRPDSPFEWVEGWDLLGARPIWILADLARSPPREGILDQVDTNGLAAGFTPGRALRSALLEVVERDAVSQHHFFRRYGGEGDVGPARRRISLDSLPPAAGALAERARKAKLTLTVEDLATDLGIPVFSSTLMDPSFAGVAGPMPLVTQGWAAGFLAETAVTQAILESVQSRLGVIHGARDSYNQVPPSRGGTDRHLSSGPAEHDFSTVPSGSAPDFEAEIGSVLEKLRSAGITQVIAIDLTRKTLDVHVMRVRVPGLSLYTIDHRRIGWRSARHVL